MCMAAAGLLTLSAKADNHSKDTDPDGDIKDKLDSVIISASRASKSTPVTFTMVGKESLAKVNPISSLPMALSLQPSVVTAAEGGTGLGYSTIRIRGVGASQINVTLNGVTLNDSESQEVFWVNIPALSNILSSVQMQRGLGTSANGSGAFGASINMSTASVGDRPFANFEVGRGSWNTLTSTVSAGTGLLPSGFYASFAYSRDYTDGYIRNAYAKVQSAFGVLGWLKGNNSLKLTYLMGDQTSGLTWNGLDIDKYQAGDYKYNSAGEYYDADGNVRYYDNTTDNYTQHNLQLNYTRQFGDRLSWSTTVNWTKGDGYYEDYKANKKFSKYGFDQSGKSDFITRKWMNNDLYVVNSSVKYVSDKLDLTAGAYLSFYDGNHNGRVRWASKLGDDYDYASHEWYRNTGDKKEYNIFARGQYSFSDKLQVFADLQYRRLTYELDGIEDDFIPVGYKMTKNFFNPRFGLTYNPMENMKIYASAAIGHREPSRSDLKESICTKHESGRDVNLRPERMVDVEFGIEHQIGDKFLYSLNFYLMEYKDMLLETGRISNTGRAIKENVPKAYRRGIEAALCWTPTPLLKVDANLGLSTNKVRNYTAFFTDVDADGNENYAAIEKYLGTVTMIGSPSVTAMAAVTVMPFKTIGRGSLKSTTLSLDGKWVGRQYGDNNEVKANAAPGYFVSNLALSHEFNLGGGKLGISGYINNLFGERYYSVVWASYTHYADGDSWAPFSGVLPQAPRNFSAKVYYRF